MDNNKKNGNWLTELLEELKLSLVISYLELFVTCADAKEYVQKNKDNLTPAALNKREMKKVKAAPWLNFFGSLFFLLAVGSVVASFVLHMTLSPLVFVAADVLFVILVVMLPVSAKRKEVWQESGRLRRYTVHFPDWIGVYAGYYFLCNRRITIRQEESCLFLLRIFGIL